MAITEIDEKLLVRAYQAGDERAFDTIVRTQWKALYAHAVRRLTDHEAAEDAVQDTLLRAYRALPNLDGDLALRAWLHRILTNVCYDEGNRRRRALALQEKVEALPEEQVQDIAEEAVLHDTVRIMSEALKDLPDSYREALVLRYVDGLSFREVAEATGVTEENARARVHRGRLMLHKVLAKLTVLAAFIIPGLRRTQPAPADDGGTSLVTQLTSHAMSAAPSVTSAATQAAMLPSGKSALLTGALAAAAAVTVPVAAYTVHEVSQPEAKRQVAVGDPFPSTTSAPRVTSGPGTDAPTTTIPTPDGSTTTAPTVTTLPPSAVTPFEIRPGSQESTPPSSTPTTAAPAPDPQPTPEPEPTVKGALATVSLVASPAGADFDLSGTIALADGRQAQLDGRLYVRDGQAKAESLRLVVDGVEYTLKFRGPLTDQVAHDDGSTTYRFTGKFVLPDGADLGLPEQGDVLSGSFRDGDSAVLSLELEGPAPAES